MFFGRKYPTGNTVLNYQILIRSFEIIIFKCKSIGNLSDYGQIVHIKLVIVVFKRRYWKSVILWSNSSHQTGFRAYGIETSHWGQITWNKLSSLENSFFISLFIRHNFELSDFRQVL